ncbi:MAG: GNAT family N-acetyltransferase [Clostridiales bacterium]|nr:GNAT family N-acetyltransferase [Clostridiales bacterium]
MAITQAASAQVPAIAALAKQLWDHHEQEELQAEFEHLIKDSDCAVFLYTSGGHAVAFAQVQLRRDYVQGTSTSPVGYLEGIFVEPAHRKQGIATQLVRACQDWARAQGCREFASDCPMSNQDSYRFHLALGFVEAGRIICFQKTL